jgi:hypothetical protein
MANEPYASARFKVWAIFETDSGTVRFDDVIAASASFALNTIPTASLVVAVGINAVTGEPATIHEAKARLKARDKATVYLTIFPGAGDTQRLRAGTYVIFEGLFVGIGYQRSHNHANYALNLTHWLDDLNNSSAINGNWCPGVPHDYAQQATYDRIQDVSDSPTFAPVPGFTNALCSHNNITSDLWDRVIKGLFLQLAGYSPFRAQNAAPDPNANAAAKAALDKMPGDGIQYYKPLEFQLGAADSTNISESFAKYFTSTIGSSFVQNSFWAKLITEYAAQCLFAISPAVKWALPIPFCAGLRWQPGGKTIRATEYNYANFNANMNQIIESVEIAFPLSSNTNLSVTTTPPAGFERLSYYRPAAYYPTEVKQDKRGLKLFKTAPIWAANADPSTLVGLRTTVDARTTVKPNPPNGANLPGDVKDTGTAYRSLQATLAYYAQHMFVTEVLQQRFGELSGPLRFDIAPGSVVKIATPPRDRVDFEEDGDPKEYVIATVMGVSYVINSERATAGTSFTIAHTKTEAEISPDSIYAVDTPPMYKQAWQHGPLAEPLT